MKNLILFFASFMACLAAGAQAQSFGYTDYSFKNQMNVGSGITGKATTPSAWLEIGPAGNTSARGVLMPRGDRNAVVNPVMGLIFYDVNDRKFYQYNGFAWEMVGGIPYTDAMARNAVAAALVNSSSISFNTAGSTITADVNSTAIRNLFSTAPGSGISYDAASGVFNSTALNSITLNAASVLYNTPVNFPILNGAAAGTMTLKTQTANSFFAGPTSGAAAAPTFRALVSADIPAGSGNYIQNQNTVQQAGTYKINGAGYMGALYAGTQNTQSGYTHHMAGNLFFEGATTIGTNNAQLTFNLPSSNGRMSIATTGTQYALNLTSNRDDVPLIQSNYSAATATQGYIKFGHKTSVNYTNDIFPGLGGYFFSVNGSQISTSGFGMSQGTAGKNYVEIYPLSTTYGIKQTSVQIAGGVFRNVQRIYDVETIFYPNGDGTLAAGGAIKLGSLVVDPAGANGMSYYNSTSNRYKAYQNGVWVNYVTEKASGIVNIGNAPIYDDDAAAGSGGLVSGDVYKTAAGHLMIKL